MLITKLDHQNQEQAIQIWAFFRSAYEIEAQVLGVEDFPPLNRTLRQFQEAVTTFFGGWHYEILVAAAEIEEIGTEQLHINSFGVSPDHFRKGHGSKLLNWLLDELVWQRITVSTAVANTPSLRLYQKYGFHPRDQWINPDNFQMMTLLLEKTA